MFLRILLIGSFVLLFNSICFCQEINNHGSHTLKAKMKELKISLPKEYQQYVDKRGWIAWRGLLYQEVKTDDPISFIVKYLTIDDNDMYFTGHFILDFHIQATAAYHLRNHTVIFEINSDKRFAQNWVEVKENRNGD